MLTEDEPESEAGLPKSDSEWPPQLWVDNEEEIVDVTRDHHEWRQKLADMIVEIEEMRKVVDLWTPLLHPDHPQLPLSFKWAVRTLLEHIDDLLNRIPDDGSRFMYYQWVRDLHLQDMQVRWQLIQDRFEELKLADGPPGARDFHLDGQANSRSRSRSRSLPGHLPP